MYCIKFVLITMLLATLILNACQSLQAPITSAPEYAHPEALVSTDWLAEHLSDPAVRVLDTRNFLAEEEAENRLASYKAGHIPGAIYVDVRDDISDPNGDAPLLILPEEGFESVMGRLGIDNDTTVVAYDDGGNTWSARLWWALRYYGHKDVKLLNGGLKKWTLEERPLETGVNTPESATFRAQIQPHLLATVADVQEAIEDPGVTLIDSLPAEFYNGEWNWPGLRAGHIPTALNLFVGNNLDPTDETLLPMDTLTQQWQDIGLKPEQRVITYCGAGYAGAMNLFVLYQMGFEDVSLYDGSWMEWGADESLPVKPAKAQIDPIIDPDSTQPIRVLFIGNSDTFWNKGLDAHLLAMAASADPPIVLETAFAGLGGASLWELLETDNVVDTIRDGNWDVVIVQNAGLWEPDKLPKAVVDSVGKITDASAQPVLSAHWSSGDPQSAICMQTAADLSIPMVPAGLAWDKAMVERPDIALHGGSIEEDHASRQGTYLNTAVIFTTLFGQNPAGNPYRPVDLLPEPDSVSAGLRRDIELLHEQWQIPEEEIAFLQHVAWETVLENQ